MSDWNSRYNMDEDDEWNPRYNAFDVLESIAYRHKQHEQEIQWLSQSLKNLVLAHNHSIGSQDDVRQENVNIARQNALLKEQLNATNKHIRDLHIKVATMINTVKIEMVKIEKQIKDIKVEKNDES